MVNARAGTASERPQRRRRVFFLGAHKILLKTEVPRLRALGLEVFCPPYRQRSLFHQSLTTEWDSAQPTTLPADVVAALCAFDFFGRRMTAEAADLLNAHFDSVIVTCDPGWLINALLGFDGQVIFRTYGQVFVLSDYLASMDAMRMIAERDDFWFVPHAAEAVVDEAQWLKDRMRVVPYVPSLEAMSIAGRWRAAGPHRREIMIACPNLVNPYYFAHYQHLKKHFSDAIYRYYGVQMKPVDDPQVVGTLPAGQYFPQFEAVAGFLYTYREPTVCFLPPIEMMIAGGPVVFLAGSLLCRQMPRDAPGRARDEAEARDKCRRLLDGDAAFVDSVIASQQAVAARFFPENVWPAFDAAFDDLFGAAFDNDGSAAFGVPRQPGVTWLVDVDDAIDFADGRYTTKSERLLRLRRAADEAGGDVVVAVTRARLERAWGFFRQGQAAPERIHFFCVDHPAPRTGRSPHARLDEKVRARVARRLRTSLHQARPLQRLAGALGDGARVIVADEGTAAALSSLVDAPIAIA